MGGFQALCTVVYCPHFPSHHPSLNPNESKMEEEEEKEDDQPTNYHIFQGVVDGTIVEPRGDRLSQITQLFSYHFSSHLMDGCGFRSFGWDPIFMPKGFDITYSEMDKPLKNSMSHRFTHIHTH